MTTIAEKARLEAERAEAEDDNDAGDDEHAEPEQPVEQSEPPAHPGDGLEEPSEEMMVELAAACHDHHDHVRAIMGPFVDGFVVCSDCNGIGIGIAKPETPHLELKSGTQECPICKGEGDLALPTKRQGFDREQCENCNGKGWVGRGNLPPIDAAAAAAASAGAPAAIAGVPAPIAQPSTTDPRVLALQAEGFIVLPKPS